MSQKYVVAHFINADNVPDEFVASQWPLHVTLLANFTIAQPLEKLISALANYAKQTKVFDITADGEAQFGPEGNVSVSLIRPNENIAEIHSQLTIMTEELGAVYDETRFMGDGYRPHATIQADSRLADGQVITVNNFTLVDMYPHNDIGRRAIITTFPLTG